MEKISLPAVSISLTAMVGPLLRQVEWNRDVGLAPVVAVTSAVA